MIKIRIIALGRLKERYLREAFDEYVKRIKGYASVEVIELEPERLREAPSKAEIEKALLSEAAAIKKKIPESAFVVAMCIEGKQFSSEGFHDILSDCINQGKGIPTFIIGSSYGLHESIKKLADVKISFSAMTFPHRLFRIMLVEQLYRSFKIDAGAEYHK